MTQHARKAASDRAGCQGRVPRGLNCSKRPLPSIRRSCWGRCITWSATWRTPATPCKRRSSSAGVTRRKSAGVENLKAWIFRVALNTGRDIRETAWRRKRQGLPEDEGSAGQSRHDGPAEIVEHDERLARLRDALKQLRPEEQEVFLLRQNGELTYEEIAETLDVPTGTVKTRMRLALSRLREVLAE